MSWISRYLDGDVHPSDHGELAKAFQEYGDGLGRPGERGAAIARAVALVRRIAAREPWQDHFGKPWEEEAAEIVVLIDRH